WYRGAVRPRGRHRWLLRFLRLLGLHVPPDHDQHEHLPGHDYRVPDQSNEYRVRIFALRHRRLRKLGRHAVPGPRGGHRSGRSQLRTDLLRGTATRHLGPPDAGARRELVWRVGWPEFPVVLRPGVPGCPDTRELLGQREYQPERPVP